MIESHCLWLLKLVLCNWSNNSRKFGFVVLNLLVDSGEHDWWFIANTDGQLRSVKIWMLLLKLFHLIGSGNKADFYRCGEIMISKFPGVKYKANKKEFTYFLNYLVKFSFSEKAKKICAIFLMVWTFTYFLWPTQKSFFWI